MQTVEPLTDADLRRRVAEIDGWRFFRAGGIGFLWGCHCDFGGEPQLVPHYESDLNAAEGAVRRWCERRGHRIELRVTLDIDPRFATEWFVGIDSLPLHVQVRVPASHPHAAARAMCLCLVAADDAVKAHS